MVSKYAFIAGAALATTLSTFGVASADETGPIKIAFLAIDSGSFAAQMEENITGVKFAVDYINSLGGAGGRKFELVMGTDNGTPASAVTAATRAIQQDGAKIVMGMFTSSISASLSPKIAALGAVMIDPWSQSDDLIGKSCWTNYFRTSTSNSMIVNAAKEFVKQSGIKSWDLISVDYAAGHDFATKFGTFVGDAGGKVNASLFAPLGTTDFGSYISQLQASPSEALFVTIFGSDTTAFTKQQAQFGLFKKYKLVLGNGFTSPSWLNAHGDADLGVDETLSYDSSLPTPKNEAFVKAFHATHVENPSYNDADIFAGVELAAAAIDKAKSAEAEPLKAALAGLKTSTIFGDVELRAADHQLVRQVLITEVVKGADGKPAFTVKANMAGPAIIPPPSADCKM